MDVTEKQLSYAVIKELTSQSESLNSIASSLSKLVKLKEEEAKAIKPKTEKGISFLKGERNKKQK